MIRARVRLASRRSLALEVEQRIDVTLIHSLRSPLVKLETRGRRSHIRPRARIEPHEIVGGEARAHDQRALLAQRRQLLADLVELLRIQSRHGKLQNRHVRIRIHLHQRHVCAVIEAAGLVVIHRLVLVREQLRHIYRQLRRERRVVLRLVVLLREAIEIVKQRHLVLESAHHNRRLLPVRADHKNVFRLGEVRAPGSELASPEGVVGKHRGAVTHVKHWHCASFIRFTHDSTVQSRVEYF